MRMVGNIYLYDIHCFDNDMFNVSNKNKRGRQNSCYGAQNMFQLPMSPTVGCCPRLTCVLSGGGDTSQLLI